LSITHSYVKHDKQNRRIAIHLFFTQGTYGKLDCKLQADGTEGHLIKPSEVDVKD